MKVRVAAKPETVHDVIAFEAENGLDEPFVGEVAEMATDAKQLRTFGFSEEIQARGHQLAQEVGDEEPMFVVVRTEAGESRSGRFYGDDVLVSIAEQVNYKQPVGFLGHIKDSDISTSFPEPQTTWFGAITRKEKSEDKQRGGETVTVIYTAGYILPGSQIKTYIKSKAVNSTSWQGYASQTPIPGRGVKVTSLDLHSIDWSRKGAEGMPTARVVALAREMDTGARKKEGKTKMDGEKSLAEVSPDEYKDGCPNGYALLVREIAEEKDGVIGEMQTQIDAAEADKSLVAEIRDLLKLNADENPLAKIAALVKRLGEKAKASVDDALDELLAEKVPDEETRKLVRRLLPVAEMATKAEGAEDTEAVKTLVGEMVEEAFDKDDVIQTYVSEMAPPVVRRREQLRGSKGVDYDKLGMKRERKVLA